MKVLVVTTISNTINAFLIPHIKSLIDNGCQVDLAFNEVQELKQEVYDIAGNIYQIPLQRSPLKMDNYRAYQILKKIIINEKYDIVHTHTPIASAIVRIACRNINRTKVFYTAHGFHFFKGASFLNWLIYFRIEKVLSRYTDVLITINNEDYDRAKRKFKAKKVEYIPGIGIDYNKFISIRVNRDLKRRELRVPNDSFVVLSVGELNKNKNHRVIIKAISKIDNPNIHYVICGEGKLREYLMKLSKELGIGERVHLLGFRKDIAEICKASDVFAFPSKREGLGLAAIEAMACGLPIISSNIHGIKDYSKDGITGYTCNPNDLDGFIKSIKNLIKNDKQIEEMGNHNLSAASIYASEVVMKKMMKIYNLGGADNESNSINNCASIQS